MSIRYFELLMELADIERQQEDLKLSHSDQQLLDQAWEEINNELEEIIEEQEKDNAIEDNRECSRCSGCAYCEGDGGGYDGSDEV